MAEHDDMLTSSMNQRQGFERNKFVYVNRNREPMLQKSNTVLINPHFKENKTVFLNPNFQIAKNETTRPKVHINPNILKSITSLSQPATVNSLQSIEIPTSYLQNAGSSTMSFENKKIQTIDYGMKQVEKLTPAVPVIKNTYCHFQKANSYCKINSFDNRKIVHTKTKIVNIPQKSTSNLTMNSIASQKSFPITEDSDAEKPKCYQGNKRKIYTRLKIVNIPENGKENIKSPIVQQKTDLRNRTNSIHTRFKYIRKEKPLPSIHTNQKLRLLPALYSQTSESMKTGNLRRTVINDNNSLRRNSIVTRYKYIRNGAKLLKVNKNSMKTKYKIVNNISNSTPEVKKTTNSPNSPVYRKKYVFINKYNSSSFLASNVILKNTKQRNLININGILYQNSPCLLKRVSPTSKSKNHIPSVLKGKVPKGQVIKCQGKYKIVRSQLASASKLKKSNIACLIYKKTGKCSGQKNGKCIKVHNPDQIILCKSFLRGECQDDNCLLSHKVSSEKMPTCKYFLEGLCTKVECQYLHVKISPNAEICRDFLEGFCKDGIKCEKRHQFLCPEYEKNKKCSKPKCRYPHGSSKVMKPKSLKKNPRKIIAPKVTKTRKVEQTVGEIPENNQIRYYKDNSKNKTEESPSEVKRCNSENVEEMTIPKRKKLGSLPSFIPIL